MSGRHSIPRPGGCGDDAAPYLLGALEPGDAQAFVSHLYGCTVCRDELAALAPVLDALPDPVPTRRVPRTLRRRVLRAVRAEPKTAVPRRAAPRTGWLALGLAVAAAAIVVTLRGPTAHPRVIPAAVGQAKLHVADGRGELVVARLARLPADRTYELWLVSGSRRPVASTLFDTTSRGSADLGVPGVLHGVTRLLVTVEPRGGSIVPTTRAVIQIDLARVPPPVKPI